MTTPVYPSKRFYAAGFKLGSAWGDAVALGTTNGILIESDGNPSLKQPYNAHEDIDAIMPKDGDLGPIAAIDFSPDYSERYDPGPLGSMIAALFGTSPAPTPAPGKLYTVSAANNKIDFDQGGESELHATVASLTTYTGATLATAIAFALNAVQGVSPTLVCSYSATTGKFTISQATGELNLLWESGTNTLTNIATLCGYSKTGDDTGALTYTSDTETVGVYKHVMDWADYISLFGTFAVERPGTILEVPSAMPMKYNLKVAGGLLKGSIGLRGDTVVVVGATNTDSEMTALTYRDKSNRIKFGHGVVRMNAEADGALDSNDVLEVSDIDIAYERMIDDVHAAGSDSIILPREKGFKMTVKVTLPRDSAANQAYLATFLAMTAQKMDITFTSPVVAGSGLYYSRTYAFPRLKFTEPPVAPLADIMTTVLTGEAEESIAEGGPTGMTGHYRPYIEAVNLQSTGYLA
jgi:hypothetical protein